MSYDWSRFDPRTYYMGSSKPSLHLRPLGVLPLSYVYRWPFALVAFDPANDNARRWRAP